MKKFKDFNITVDKSDLSFVGDKIKITKILNKTIVVLDYKVNTSKFKSDNMCLFLQIEMNQIKYVVFTGSKILQSMIDKVEKSDFPFETTIVEEDGHYEFT